MPWPLKSRKLSWYTHLRQSIQCYPVPEAGWESQHQSWYPLYGPNPIFISYCSHALLLWLSTVQHTSSPPWHQTLEYDNPRHRVLWFTLMVLPFSNTSTTSIVWSGRYIGNESTWTAAVVDKVDCSKVNDFLINGGNSVKWCRLQVKWTVLGW